MRAYSIDQSGACIDNSLESRSSSSFIVGKGASTANLPVPLVDDWIPVDIAAELGGVIAS